jgi:hypothetical protein
MKLTSGASRGRWMVSDNADLLKQFYFLQRELVLMQAGWVPGMAHWESKLLLPEFLWQDALIAGQLRERVLELRYPDSHVVPGKDQPLLDLWRQFRAAPDSQGFVVGLAHAMKPTLKLMYEDYLQATDHLDDGPTVRILEQAVRDIDGQLRRWEPVLADSRAVYPESVASSGRWQAELARVIQDAKKSLPTFDPKSAGGRPFQISRTGVRDKRFPYVQIPWPDSLDPKRGAGEGFELQVRQAQSHLNEMWATEMAAACLFDLADDAPPEFLQDAARWCYDEARHCRMGVSRFQEWGFRLDEMPAGSFSYDAGANTDPITRLGIIFYFETTYIHTKSERKDKFSDFGDRVSSHDMDFDWADELIHTYYGKKWLEFFLKKSGDKRTLSDVKADAEACVQAMRQRATPTDRRRIEELYQRTMARARVQAHNRADSNLARGTT